MTMLVYRQNIYITDNIEKKMERSDIRQKQKQVRQRSQAPSLRPINALAEISIERQVYDALRGALMRGELKPGSKLSIRSISDSLSISTTPVREALKRLEADGVIASHAKSGFTVRHISKHEFQEILQLRLEIEGMVVRKAALNMNPARIASLKRIARAMRSAKEMRTIIDLNYQFHFTIYSCAEMPFSLSIIENIWLRLGPAIWKMAEQYPTEKADTNHARIIEALSASNVVAAEQAFRNDLLDGATGMGFESASKSDANDQENEKGRSSAA